MPQKDIYCVDCAAAKADLEKGGRHVFVSCEPLPDQENVPEEKRKCRLKWKLKPL